MTVFKLLGMIFVFTSISACGFSVSATCKNACMHIRGFVRLVTHIRARIECFNQPLDEIYVSFEDEPLEKAGFLPVLREKGFEAALIEYEKVGGADKRALDLLYEFSDQLGKSFSSEQVRHCERYLRLLEEELALVEAGLPQKTKLIRTISLSVAVMAVIIFI